VKFTLTLEETEHTGYKVDLMAEHEHTVIIRDGPCNLRSGFENTCMATMNQSWHTPDEKLTL
jgi:hypothetical protein